MIPLPDTTWRRVISAFRFHSRQSPAEAAALRTTLAVAQGLSDPRRPPPGVCPGAVGHQHRRRCSIGEVRRELRPWVGGSFVRPVPEMYVPEVVAVSRDVPGSFGRWSGCARW